MYLDIPLRVTRYTDRCNAERLRYDCVTVVGPVFFSEHVEKKMPYGGRSYRRAPARGATRATRRYKRPVGAKAPYRRKKPSYAMIAQKALTLAQYNNKVARGSWQTNLHISRSAITPSAFKPRCFHVVTPRQNERIYKFDSIPGGNQFATQEDSSWVLPTLAQTTGGLGLEQFDMWAECNDDNINGKYYLQTVNLTFTVKPDAQLAQAVRYRIDFVVPNRRRIMRTIPAPTGPQTTLEQRNFNLPDCLGSFQAILFHENRVNPMYWRFVRKPAYFTVRPQQLHSGATAGAVAGTVQFVQKHIKLKINKLYNPRDVGSATDNQTYAYLGLQSNEQMWCIISCDAQERVGPLPEMFLTRQISWRDRVGHAA